MSNPVGAGNLVDERPAAVVRHPDRPPSDRTPEGQSIARWGVRYRLRPVVVAEAVAATVGLVIVAFAGPGPVRWPVVASAAAGAAVVVLVWYRQATMGGWLLRWARLRRGRHDTVAQRRAAVAEPVAAELLGADAIGVRQDGKFLVTMIALHGHGFAPVELVAAGLASRDTVPLGAPAGLLHQFAGLDLDCVDVVSVNERVASDGDYTARYDEIIGDRAAVGQRRTWLVVRLCPQACLPGIVYRGDAHAAAAAATERIRQAVVAAGCRATACTVEQMSQATTILAGGADLSRLRERWDDIEDGADYLTSYRIAGVDLNTRLLDEVCTVRSTRTVQLLRITPSEQGPQVGALVRFRTSQPLRYPPLAVLHPLRGRQFDALAAALPWGDRSGVVELSKRPLSTAELQIPVGAAGPLLGMSAGGCPYLMPLADPLRSVRVRLNTGLDVAIPLLLRAAATGSVIIVHTDRPQMWEPICDGVRIGLAGGSPLRHEPSMMVVDGAGHSVEAGERGHTTVLIGEERVGTCDITITQVGRDELSVAVEGRDAVRLQVMRPRNEAQFVSHLRQGV
ncbi:type VII secretion protein EccE [Mycobacterium sp. M1]|uniref:Type VII secretion protein EccE n=1 Tax=Mycolicibacter acidiphilus TaxID=2835306 RepID=A0ABS5RNW1_9MYCO|nr:type VII secretion protein EccE [Mycolicibacter acidiphilus]MBS9535993.1 type VII secretion protein EccE [Mycolicibacter acidiphilus]